MPERRWGRHHVANMRVAGRRHRRQGASWLVGGCAPPYRSRVDDHEDEPQEYFAEFVLDLPPDAPLQPDDAAGRARRALSDEVVARVRGLGKRRLRAFTVPWRWRDPRTGDDHDVTYAAMELCDVHGRRIPDVALEDQRAEAASYAAYKGLTAIAVADLMSHDDFAYLTEPLSLLVELDLASRHASLRPAGVPAGGPLVAPEEPDVEPLPGHELWRHTRDRLVAALEGIAGDDDSDVYVVDLHLDVEWLDDIRNAGIELRYSTQRDLASRRHRWERAPLLPEIDSLQVDELAWDWCSFRHAGEGHVVWRASSDPGGHALLADYARATGLWYSDAELAADDCDRVIELSIELASYLQVGLARVVRALHDNGEIARIFGAPIPVTFSAQDSHERAWEWGQAANPPELYALFGPTQQRGWSAG
jgi:hypothetical protein